MFSPEFSLEEINKYKSTIIRRHKITEESFENDLCLLKKVVTFIPVQQYEKSLSYALLFCPDEDDVDFFALATHMNCPLWSNDKTLKKQSLVYVLSTHELAQELKFL